jgi:hypothetical protein
MEVAGAAQEAAKNLEMTRTIILFVTCTRCPSPRRVASVVQTRRSAVFIQFDPVTGSARKCQSLPFGVQKTFPARWIRPPLTRIKRSDQSRAGDLGDQAMPASTCRRSPLSPSLSCFIRSPHAAARFVFSFEANSIVGDVIARIDDRDYISPIPPS